MPRTSATRISARPRAVAVVSLLLLAACLRALDGPAPFPAFDAGSASAYLQEVAGRLAQEMADDPKAIELEARVLGELGLVEEAERLTGLALERSGGRADLAVSLADLRIRQSRLSAAQAAIEQGLRRDPAVPGGYRRLGMIRDRQGDRVGARAAFEEAVRREPTDATAHLLLGQLLLDDAEPADAIEQLEAACRLAPDSANGFYALAQAQVRSGDREAARQTLVSFRRLKEAEQRRADALNAGRDDARAMQNLAGGFHVEAAELLLARGRSAAAGAHLTQAIAVQPEAVKARERLGLLRLREGRPAEAREHFEQLVRLEPDEARHHANLGTLLLQLEDVTTAVPVLRRALELDPRQPQALNNLARWLLARSRQVDEALALCRRLVEVQSTAANHDLLAWACYANGRADEAREASARSVALAPDNPVYRERLRRLQSSQ
ncbi:MAG: tetratricopeptide repeat protein [Verrucomicrobiales bacterium]|nr:tetratricopeptide repeat protein [Verrucomicrobiales bacterium]